MSASTDLKLALNSVRKLWIVLLLILLFSYLASGLYSVKAEQRGVVKRFGKVIADTVPPGIHYHLPWPFESVALTRTTEIRSLTVEFKEVLGSEKGKAAGVLLTGDENHVMVDILVQYSISNPKDYLYRAVNTQKLLRRLISSESVYKFADMSVDYVLTAGRHKIQTELRRMLQQSFDKFKLGIRITSVQIQKLEPPKEVARAFKDVASAREDKQKLVEQARGDKNRKLPKARSQAQRMISEAQAYTREVTEAANGEAKRFLLTLEEYSKSKNLTAHRLHMETMEELLPKVRKVIANPEAEKNVPKGGRGF